MVLFHYPVFVHFARKIIQNPRVKSEVIFRHFSSGVEKQIISEQSHNAGAVNNEEEKSSLTFISETAALNLVPKTSNNENESFKQKNKFDSLFEIHRDDFEFDDSLHGFTPKLPKALDPSTEDLSDLGSNIGRSFNFASFADKSPTIQEFVKLGVELWKIEKYPEITSMMISLDFEKDVKPYIVFLHDCGVPTDRLGTFFTKNPRIFKEDLDDLRTRIRYLRAHAFEPHMIQRILTSDPTWLSFSTKDIDTRLGYFQHGFKLKGSQLRLLVNRLPRLITYNIGDLDMKTFAFSKEMGFELPEMKRMLLSKPRLWTKCRRNLVDTFDYAHNTMYLSHEIISKQPAILLCRKRRLEARHAFLVELKKAQYDPLKPMYISPQGLVSGTDAEFCNKIADTSVSTYNMFLKTL